MWRITLVLNALLMGVFSLGSAASQVKLRNQYIQYPHVGEGLPPLPAISDLALRCQWLLKAMPLAWALLTLTVLVLNWRKTEARRCPTQYFSNPLGRSVHARVLCHGRCDAVRVDRCAHEMRQPNQQVHRTPKGDEHASRVR